MKASRTLLLPPSPDLAAYVHAIAVRRPSPQGPALPALQCFPANVLGALTVLHRGDWLDADSGDSLAPLELAGPRLTPARRRYANDPSITTVLLRPGVLQWLFDLPAADWVGQRHALPSVVGAATARNFSRLLAQAQSTAAEVWVVEQQVQRWIDMARAREPWSPPPAAPTSASVFDWAVAAPWGARQLRRLVKQRLGVSPKAWLRVERLQMGLEAVTSGTPLGEVAARCGYSHAAHMVREFRALTGLSPAGVRRDVMRHEGLPWLMASTGWPGIPRDQDFTQST